MLKARIERGKYRIITDELIAAMEKSIAAFLCIKYNLIIELILYGNGCSVGVASSLKIMLAITNTK